MIWSQEVMFLFVVFSWCRIWRIRCTLLSRGDARCWRISMTPKATAKHQHPFLPTLPSFLPSLLALSPQRPPAVILQCTHTNAPRLSPPLFCFLLAVIPSSHSPLRCRVIEWHDCTPPISFSSSPHVLASERHFPCGFTRCSFLLLIIEGKFWGLFMHRRVQSHLFMSGLMMRHYHVQLPSTCYHARLSFSPRKLFWCWNITEQWTWNYGKKIVVDEGIMIEGNWNTFFVN